MSLKSWFKVCVYASVLFLVFYLMRQDWLAVPRILSPWSFAFSLPFLFAGFLGHALSWHQALKESGYPTSLRDCIASVGLSVFGKYVPGKLWTIVGRATYLADRTEYSLSDLSAMSLQAQFITLWTGLLLGSVGLVFVPGGKVWAALILVGFVALTAAIFTPFFHAVIERLTLRFLKRELKLPRLRILSTVRLLPWFLGFWVFWAAGFYFLVRSLCPVEPDPSVALCFPLAATLGIMAVICPGGIGVREGVMAGSLSFAGISLRDATAITFAARVWFLIGEAGIFLTGVFAGRKSAYRKDPA